MGAVTVQVIDQRVVVQQGENTLAARQAAVRAETARDEILENAGFVAVSAALPDIEDVAPHVDALEVVADDLNLGGSSLLAAGPDAIAAAATIGLDTRNPASLGAFGGVDASDTVTRRAALFASVPGKSIVANQFESAKRAQMRKTVDGIGHSAMQGSGVVSAGATVNSRAGINGSLPRHLAYLLSQYDMAWRVINRGQSAQKSHEIAARMGAIPMNITLNSGTTLAASGAVGCTTSPGSNGPSAQRGTSLDIYDGFIGNQACRLTNTGTGINAVTLVYTIEQVDGTGDITVNPGTPFWLAPDPLDHAIKLIWATENDGDNQLSFDMAGAMIEKLPQDERRFILMGDWPFSTGAMDAGSTAHNDMLAKNAEFRLRYGGNFFDVYKFLRGDYPYDGTVWPSIWQMTGESEAQSSNDYVSAGDWVTLGRIPRRWISIHKGGADLNHFHEDTNWWLAQALIEFHFKPKGWLA